MPQFNEHSQISSRYSGAKFSVGKLTLALALVIASGAAASGKNYGRSSVGSSLYGTGSNPSSHYVAPSIRRDGRSTRGHYQTNPNNTQRDNFGTLGNWNPFTGFYGSRAP